ISIRIVIRFTGGVNERNLYALAGAPSDGYQLGPFESTQRRASRITTHPHPLRPIQRKPDGSRLSNATFTPQIDRNVQCFAGQLAGHFEPVHGYHAAYILPLTFALWPLRLPNSIQVARPEP